MSENNKLSSRILFTCIFSLSLCVFGIFSTQAQTGTSSPYSSFGIGETNNGTFSTQDAMAGTAYAQRRATSINFANPASYSAMQLTTFETALKSNFIRSHFKDSTQIRNSSSVGYLAFGFPISKKMGASFGLVPLSSSGYKFYFKDSTANIGRKIDQYESTGGVNQVYIGAGYSVLKNLSIGVNTSFLFGSIEKTSTAEYPDLTNSFNSRVIKSNSFGDFYPGIGIQFTSNNLKTVDSDSIKSIKKRVAVLKNELKNLSDSLKLSKDSLAKEVLAIENERKLVQVRKVAGDWKFTTGLVFNPQMNIRTRASVLAERYRYTGGFMVTEDTVLYTNDAKSKMTLPPKIGIGFSLGNNESWLLGADITYQDWSLFTSDNGSENLKSTILISAGAEHVIQSDAVGNYLKRIRYRMGARYARTFLNINGTPIDDYGFSFGWGLPIKKAQSIVNISADIGSRGTSQHSLIKEASARLTLGFTLNDRWFVRKKFD